MKAIERFGELEEGILHVIKAADVYLICVISEMRGESVNAELIQEIIAGKKVSTFVLFSGACSMKERQELYQKGHIRGIGSQVVLATYTALEVYLREKFEEYLRHKLQGINADAVLKRCSFRSLDNIKNLFREFLGIHLPLFELSYITVDEGSSFKPGKTWDGIKSIEEARHDMAHLGTVKRKNINLVSDMWDRFDFARRWVASFDANFDSLVYEGRRTSLIREYERRML